MVDEDLEFSIDSQILGELGKSILIKVIFTIFDRY